MARTHCLDCGGLRELDSPSKSYCRPCYNERARKRYQADREAAGFVVQERPKGEGLTRRQFIATTSGKAGPCECCTEPYDKLETVYLGDRENDDGSGEMFGLFCKPCAVMTLKLTPDELTRVVHLLAWLKSHKVELKQTLFDPMYDEAGKRY